MKNKRVEEKKSKNKILKFSLIFVFCFIVFGFTIVNVTNSETVGITKNIFSGKAVSGLEVSGNNSENGLVQDESTEENKNIFQKAMAKVTGERISQTSRSSSQDNISRNGTYTEKVESVSIESVENYSSNTPGSWHIDKSAKWTGADTANVTFDVKSILKETNSKHKDIILVLDISGSMSGEKLEKVKNDSKGLVESILSDSNNRVALIVYDSNSEILSDFTNDKNVVVSKIETLTDKGCTNYNAPLKNIDEIMSKYTKEENREVTTLFLTDGYPNEDTPNQVGTYGILKSKYPYMTINGIQYEMGSTVKKELQEISDNQWIASMDTLNNVLFEAALQSVEYEKYEIVDYIDKNYFILNSEDDIEVSIGTVKLEEENGLQKITWAIDSAKTGFNAKMNINLQLKEQYVDSKGFYSTNDNEKITYKLENEENQVTSNKTPVLEKKQFKVKYDVNSPTGCTVDTGYNTEEEHSPGVKVSKKIDKLTCEGYIFKGWEVSEDVKNVNENIFIMPENDVTIRATWTKQGIAKSMDGTVREAMIDIEVGDIVNYSPSGTYNWNAEYATSYATTDSNYQSSNQILNSSEDNFKITQWKVLNVDEENRKIDMVPIAPTTGNVKLHGAQGYNNAVYLLNEACSKLYSNESKGISARSINMDDIEGAMKKNKFDLDTYKSNYNIIPKYGTQYSNAYTANNSRYPVIYGQEKNAIINPGIASSLNLGMSKQDNLIKRAEGNDKDNRYIGSMYDGSTTIRPYQTFYYMGSSDLSNALGTTYADVLGIKNNKTYWVASRCVNASSSFCSFYVRIVWGGGLASNYIFISYGNEDYTALPLFPVVSLSSDVIEETTTEGTFNVK